MERRYPTPAKPPNPAMPYREDCWSEGETSTLVNAWGTRYLELNRGNLRQKQWQEVADSVNSRPGGGRRPPRTDVQCKNRIDTLKKKYKIEKTKMSANGAAASQWPFYSHLDMLVGSSVPPTKKLTPSRSPPLALPLTSHRASPPKQKRSAPVALPFDDSFIRKNYSAAAAAAAAAAATDVDSGWSSRSSRSSVDRGYKLKRCDKREVGEGDGIRDLARAIERFAEIYEKVEGEKQRQMMELEKEKMDFMKGLEFQRMQMFVDTQIQLERIKRTKRNDAGEIGLSAVLPFLLQTPLLNV